MQYQGKQTRNIMLLMAAIILISVCLLWLSGCKWRNFRLMPETEKTEHFSYYIYDEGTEKARIGIVSFTEKGKEQAVLVIPDYIDGYPVKNIGGLGTGAASKNLKKIYVSKNVSYVMQGWLSSTAQGCKIIHSNYYCDDRNTLFGGGGSMFSAYVTGGYEPESTDSYWTANLSYLYNYEDSPNGNIHFVDDLDEGESVTVFPPDPEREGYSFLGWFQDEDCTEEMNLKTYVRGGKDEGWLTLYAGWEETA